MAPEAAAPPTVLVASQAAFGSRATALPVARAKFSPTDALEMGFFEEKVAAAVSATMPPIKPAVDDVLADGGAEEGAAGGSSHELDTCPPDPDEELVGLFPEVGSELFEPRDGLSLRGFRS